MKPVIKYVFAVGHRCYASDAIHRNMLRKFSSPFDFMIMDYSSAFEAINDKLVKFTKDIIICNKGIKRADIMQKQYTTDVSPKFAKLINNSNDLCYMRHNYNNRKISINQNYLPDELDPNMYNWKKCCIFLHHDLEDKFIVDTLNNRCNRFNYVIGTYTDDILLFYISQIVSKDKVKEHIDDILNKKKQNNIRSYLAIIICSNDIEKETFVNNKEEKALIFLRKVSDYNTQYQNNSVDNDANVYNYYTKEINIIKEHFIFNLIDKTTIDEEIKRHTK